MTDYRDRLVGAVLDGRYRLEALIGRGGAGAVYRALDTRLDRPVAVKVLNGGGGGDGGGDSDGAEARFAAEVRTLARFAHPNLVRLLDAGELDGRACLVMDLVDGPTLARRLASGPLQPDVAASVGAGVASALAYVHGEGIVHRDVKPANVLLGRDQVTRLADFGIARLVDTTGLTATGFVLGTPAYLAPEQVQGGDVGREVDVYALGLVLVECLTGRRAFEGTPAELTAARLHRAPDLPPGLEPQLSELLSAMTARDPGDRPTAAEVVDALGAAYHRRGSGALVAGAVLGGAVLGGAVLGGAVLGVAALGDAPTLADAGGDTVVADPTSAVGTGAHPRRVRALVLAGLLVAGGLAAALAEELPSAPPTTGRSGTLAGSTGPVRRARTTVTSSTTPSTTTSPPTTTTTTTSTTTTSTTTTSTTTAPVSALVSAETRFTSILASGVAAGSVAPQAARQLDAELSGIGAAPGPGGAGASGGAVQAFDQLVGTFYADVAAGTVTGGSIVTSLVRSLAALASAVGTSVPPPSAFAGPGAAGPAGPGNGNGHGNGNGNGHGNDH